ncbi:hypothetical protein A2866_00445 [Candidatus Roizmanbacteria bacterium RIFCSPHIGHO2_01_FULL_39_8]|uniref:N-acetyltransferase domain-containing protein n=2 Tax=Candidatus Roizmaniibacteriota TaxID=1752723 RepID=A0A1F7GG27_9BACT|nr:MAG: hypothetical protein A2866_00445 [Candidatus Roizmanbacteria bacterium RIFCSPHIGHO2_01_FULL_39_8]OGK28136.1 MAG: hypothetical protein A3C28_05560 [Candidatus Roizmanbacteria bacterium RIFCSPHIGHO2_02_FULL_39_9]
MENLKPWQIPNEQWSEFKMNRLLTVGSLILTTPTMNQVDQIAGLLRGENALVPVKPYEIVESIEYGLSLVAINPLEEDKVVGFQSLGLWTEYQLIELRSAKVDEKHRGGGVNTLMKKLAIQIGKEKYPGWNFLGFTEAESKSRGILLKLGFQVIPLERVAKEFYNLSTICPADCAITKAGHICGCQVYLLNPYEQNYN